MKKKLPIFLLLFILVSATSYSQLNSPVLVEPPKDVDVVITPVLLNWQDVPDAQCYRVEVTTDTLSPEKFEAVCNAPDSHFELPIAQTQLNTVYYWRVYACSPSGWSTPSYYFNFKTAGSSIAETIGNLTDGVIDLIVDEDIPPNQGNILIHRLQSAQNRLNQGNRFAALVQMVIFKARVIILRISNQITPSVYASLVYSADGVIDLIIDEDNPNISEMDLEKLTIPVEYNLSQNYPNPFNPSTTIEFTIPQSSNVNLVVYDMQGREITTLVNEYRGTGTYIVNWNASSYSSGVYFYKLAAGNFIQTKKMILSK